MPKVKQRSKKGKPPGLVVRERELKKARSELATLTSTGIATKVQTSRARAAIKSAEAAVKRQQDAARRAGRHSKEKLR